MFKAKNADVLFTALNAFGILLGMDKNQPKRYEMPRRGSTKLRHLLPAVEEAAKHLSDDRGVLFDKYVEKDGKGNPIIEGSSLKCKSPEDRNAFEREMSELMNDTTEFLGEPFYPEDLPDPLDPTIPLMLGTFLVDREFDAEVEQRAVADKKKADAAAAETATPEKSPPAE